MLLGVIGFSGSAFSQQYGFRVSFTDKTGSPDLSQANTFLTQRSLDRRIRLGIALDSTDRPVSPVYIDSILTLTQGVFHNSSKWLNHCVILTKDSVDILNLSGKSFIKSIELVAFFDTVIHNRPSKFEEELKSIETAKRQTIDDSYYKATTGIVQLVNGDYLHNSGYQGEGMLIGILDAGFLNANQLDGFDSVISSGRVVDQFDFVFRNDSVYNNGAHGTAVSSFIIGNLPGKYVGTAAKASVLFYRTEDDGNEMPIEMDNLVAGAERADSMGADVITASVGYNNFNYPPGSSLGTADLNGKKAIATRGANLAHAKGIIFVCSAGNEGSNGLLTPSDATEAFTVGAVNDAGFYVSFSSTGPNSSGEIKPDVAVQGQFAPFLNINNGISHGNGTSYAAPQIAGYMACLRQAKPLLSVSELKEAVRKSADQYSHPDGLKGFGVPDFKKVAAALGIIDTTEKYPFVNGFITIVPNVVSGADLPLFIRNNNAAGQVHITLFDVVGRRFFDTDLTAEKGNNYLPVRLPDALPGGHYYLSATGLGQTAAVPFIVP